MEAGHLKNTNLSPIWDYVLFNIITLNFDWTLTCKSVCIYNICTGFF